jgi:CheY-like chemotaxis protein
MQWIGKMLRFECVDTGPGIPKEDQSKLFQRFVQRGGAPGTGLGLAIAKHLVDLVGGNIGFESDPTVKPGTTCVVELPLELCNEPENPEDSRQEEITMITEPISILIIDDVAMNRIMFGRRVTKGIAPNAIIEEAPTGEEALEICKDRTFDFIIVDQHMEEAGGVLLGTDTVIAMRRRKIESIIIGCSGNDIDSDFMDAGSDWVMGKPAPPNAIILKQLKYLMSKRRQKGNGAVPAMSIALEPEKKKRRVCHM